MSKYQCFNIFFSYKWVDRPSRLCRLGRGSGGGYSIEALFCMLMKMTASM